MYVANQVYFPNLFLGDINAAENKEFFITNNITHVVDAMNLGEPQHNWLIKYLHIDILDIPSSNIFKHFNNCYDFIDEGLKNGVVLVHCMAGVSRSPTIVIAYLIKKFNMSFNTAYRIVLQHRSIIKPNYGFRRQLIYYNIMLQHAAIIDIEKAINKL